MIVRDGRIGLTRAELDDMKKSRFFIYDGHGRICSTRDEMEETTTRSFSIMEHTPHYMNEISVTVGDVTIGLYNWLDGLDAFVGTTKIIIETEEQAQAVLAAMESLSILRTCAVDQ